MIWVGGAQGAGKSTWSWRLSRAHDRVRDLGVVPAIVEGPQLMPGFDGEPPPGWGVWFVPDPGRTRLAREERLAKAESLGGRPVTSRSRVHRLLERDALIADRVRASALLSGRPVIEVPAVPDWPAIAAAASSGCRATWTATPDEYAARTADERPLIAH
jgi:hypothetical protein